ncbi:MAG: tryptophan 2,3-dioxygenase [Cyanobacteria bacterium CRU_2_1]|nr:tryptophan 2,3-dioxygenase [Cyanobacteria bacterium RU_5_0]NJR59609.1 tryptophan 2,3-dioxygenase [Cyanobacteria bacterium CRU_2_1]
MSQSYNPQPLPPLDSTIDITQNHYWSYHNLDALLQCKRPLTASQDEDLFIAVHQICELAFHQMIIDLERVLDAIAHALQDPRDPIIGDTHEACYFFQRVLRLYEIAVTTMPILGTMRAFAEFRTSIGPTSGFQSFQFRHLEMMSGASQYWEGGTQDAQGTPHIAETEFDRRYGTEIQQWLERHRSHSLRHYYEILIHRTEGSTSGDRIKTLLNHAHASPLLNAMSAYDGLQTRFHRSHLGLAIQQLKLVGVEVGTGGTSFRTYLAKYEKELSPLFPGLS